MKSSLSKRKGAKAFAKMISHSKTGKVLGVHFVGPEAAEIIQVTTLCLIYPFVCIVMWIGSVQVTCVSVWYLSQRIW